jgi:predicted ester cyclase
MNRLSWLNAWLVAIALVALSACNSAPPPPDYAAQYRPLQDAFVAVWNGGKLDDLDAIVAPNYKRHGTGPATDDLAGFKKTLNDFRTAFADMHVTIDDAYYVQDHAFYLWTFTGTNTGAGAQAQPPTGKSVKVSGLSAVRYEGGKIADEGLYYDQLDFNQQLGYTLTPPAAAK